jgi:hypothetical protein
MTAPTPKEGTGMLHAFRRDENGNVALTPAFVIVGVLMLAMMAGAMSFSFSLSGAGSDQRAYASASRAAASTLEAELTQYPAADVVNRIVDGGDLDAAIPAPDGAEPDTRYTGAVLSADGNTLTVSISIGDTPATSTNFGLELTRTADFDWKATRTTLPGGAK